MRQREQALLLSQMAQGKLHRRISRLTVFMLIVHCSLLLLITSCGKKLPPVAPESVIPEPVKELKAISRDGRLLISFIRPSKNIDGSKLTDLAGFKIMRRVIEDVEGCKTCPEKFTVLYDIDISYPTGAIAERDRIAYSDIEIEPGMKYEYRVVAYNRDGYEGPEAQRVTFIWGVPPDKPMKLTAKTGDKSADLVWVSSEALLDGSPLKGLAGYNIYRREEVNKFPLDPVNPYPLSQTSFSDFGLTNGRTYHYTVRGLIQANGSLIEGASSDEITVTPREAVIEELKGENP